MNGTVHIKPQCNKTLQVVHVLLLEKNIPPHLSASIVRDALVEGVGGDLFE